MGQRHQLYILIVVEGELIRIALHHQWLFGCNAMKMLIGLLSVISEHVSKSNPDMCDSEAEAAILSYAQLIRIPEWSPMLECNNNGITIIDAQHASKPKYCFMAVDNYTECLDARLEDVRRILAIPLNDSDDEDKVVMFSPCRGYPLSASDYIDLHYHPVEGSEKAVSIARLKEQLKCYAVLSPTECFAIFPEIYDDVDMEKYSNFWKLHNDPKEMAWARRKNFVMFRYMVGYRTSASTAAKRAGVGQVVGVGMRNISAQNRVFYDEGGLVRYIIGFL